MTVRAKLRCSRENTIRFGPLPLSGGSQREYEFHAVYDDSIPEDQRYAKATPQANLKMTVDNPAVIFEPGKNYYLDFTPVTD